MNKFDDLLIKDDDMISAALHEKEMTRMETANKRWFIAFLVVLAMLFATNVAWIVYENQFEDVVVTQDNDAAPNNFVGNNGVIYNGQTDNQSPD